MTEGNTVTTLPASRNGIPQGPPPAVALVGARAIRMPALWLLAIVGVSTAVRGAIAIRVPSPWIFPDEVLYSELAKSVAEGGLPSVRGVQSLGWGVVYQGVVAPSWVVFADPVRAYHAALATNAFVMSLAAVPAYFLSRMFVGRMGSVVVAATTVLVPSMAYTGLLATENACYPAFVLAVFLLTRAVRTPSLVNQGLAFVGLGVVALTRIQGTVLIGAYVVAVLLYAQLGPVAERRPYVRRFIPSIVASVAVALLPTTASFVRGDGLLGWLGARSGTFDGLHLHEVPQWLIFLVADLVLYVAVVPAAATAVLLGRGLSRPASEPTRLFAAIALPTLAAVLLSVSFVSASIDVDGTENLNERYVFYVVPLLFVGLALWIREGLPRPRPWAALIIALCCALPALLPIGRLGYNASFQAVALLPWLKLGASDAVIAVLVTAFTLSCGALWLVCRSEHARYLWAVAALWMIGVGAITVVSNHDSASDSATAFRGQPANWVDRAVPSGADVAVLWQQGPDDRTTTVEFWLMVTEVLNRSVGAEYRIGPPTHYGGVLPTVPVDRVDGGGIVDTSGRPVDARYVLVTCRTPVVGRVIGRAPRSLFELVEVNPPLRLRPASACATPQ
jgi:hypothetical protein